MRLVGLLLATVVGSSAYNLAFRQRNPSLSNPGTYAESVAQLTHGQQIAELERLCSSLSVNRLAQPEELQLLQQELARMKSEGAISSLDDPMAELKRCHQLRALEVAEQVAAKAAEVVVAEAAAAEAAAVAAAWVAEAEARKAADAAVAAVAAEAKAEAEAKAAAEAAAAAAAAEAAAAEAAAAEAAAAAAAAAEAEAAAAVAAEVVAAKVPAAEAPAAEVLAAEASAEAVVPTGVVVRIGSVARSGAVAPAAEVVAAPAEQQIPRQAEVAVPPMVEVPPPPKVTYTLQVEREFGRDPRLGPPLPPTLASSLPARPAKLSSPHCRYPAMDHDGTREAG